MPKVTIDGQTFEVPAGTLVVEAAKPLGVRVPVFCYHPKMQPVGMCRMCLVKVGTPKIDPATKQVMVDEQGNAMVNWMPKLQTGCTTVVSEGMTVETNGADAIDARRSVIEFLLTSHPLDCPICDKGGECPLQDHTLRYGPGKSRFYVASKLHNEKSVPLSPLIMLDRERCIQCARCIRFQDEIVGEPVLGFADRGRGLEITTFDDPPFNSNFSGNTIDICPVGALTSRDFRFTARVFELTDTPSVCQQCPDGCNLILGERDNTIKRITPRENEAVNEIWISDKCRFVHHYAHSPARLTTPMIRAETDLKPVSWYEALTFIANRLQPTLGEGGGKTIAGIASDRISNEDLFLFQKLFREVLGSNNIDYRVGWSQWNAGDALVTQFGAGVGTNIGELTKGTTILVLGADPQNEQPIMRLRLAKAGKQGANLVIANGRVTKLSESAKQSVVYRYGAEADLLYGVLRAMVDGGLHKLEQANGTDELVNALKLSVAEYADKAGVKEDALKRLAEGFAVSENGLILFGREFMFAMQNDPAVGAALNALIVLSGHFGKKNNGVIALYPHNNSTGAIDMGVLPTAKPGREATKDAGMSAKEMGLKSKVLFIVGADPAREDPKFRNPGFLIVQDLFLTETAQKADVVLPAASWAERDGTFTNTERRVQYFARALEPMKNARADWEIIQDIAKYLGARWNYQAASEVMREIAKTVPQYAKMSYERLRITARRRSSVQTVGGDSSEPVQIALGELYGDVSGVPWAVLSEGNPDAKYDVRFVEPKSESGAQGTYLAITRTLFDRGSLIQYSDIVQSRIPTASVEINSHDAEDWNIADGDRVKITIDGKPPRALDLVARVDGRVPPGVIAVVNNLDGTVNLPMGARVKVERAVSGV